MGRHPERTISLLVYRPSRMFAIVTAAALVLGGALVLALQFSSVHLGRGWWTLALMVPMVAGFAAIMRTGTTRCEVGLGEKTLVVRSVDSSRLLGPAREVACAWTEVRGTSWVGRRGDELRVDLAVAPGALVFSGARRDLEALLGATAQARG